MKFDAKTTAVLKNFSGINPSLQFKQGNVIKTRSAGKNIFGVATVDNSFDSDFAIYELSKFLGVLSLFSDPEVELSDKVLTIKEDKRRVKYVCADPSQIDAPDYEKNIAMPAPVASVFVSKQNLDDVLKGLAVLRLPELAFVADGNTIAIQAINTKNPTGDVYSIDLGPNDKTFRAVLASENVKIIPGDYEVEIAKEGIVHFQAVKQIDTDGALEGAVEPIGLDYWIALTDASSFS